jgi:integrase
MSRERTGERIQWRPRLKTWVGRARSEDGKRSAWTDLCTDDEGVAQERYARWLETGEPPSQAGKELFSKAAERVLERQETRGEKGTADRRQRVRTFALPRIGHIEISRLEAHHVASVLDAMVADQKKSGTILKMRTDISRILSALVREGSIASNVARGVELPEDAEIDDRPRIVLTDEEILEFRKKRGFESELDMMALVARDLGGHRTSDLHATDWGDYDVGTWTVAKVRRPKTDGRRGKERGGKRRATRAYELVTHAIPESVRGPLDAWWRQQGSPKTGPVFPLRKGPKAGERKTGKGISYADPLRDALWAAGIVRPLPPRTEGGKFLIGYEQAIGAERRRHCALQVDTEETRAVDFHSFRRAYGTALASSGVNLQTAMDAMGHSTESAHHRYRSARLLELPARALPGGGMPLRGAPVVEPPSPTPASPASPAATRLAKASAPIDPRLGSKDHFENMLPSASFPENMNNSRMVSSASPARIELATNALGIQRGTETEPHHDGVEGGDVRLLRSVSDSALTHDAGQITCDGVIAGADGGPDEDHPGEPICTEGASPVVPLRRPSEPALTHDLGQAIGSHGSPKPWARAGDFKCRTDAPDTTKPAESVGRDTPVAAGTSGPSQPGVTVLECLRAAARAAVDEENWERLRQLEPLIDAEKKRAAATAPVSLEVVRAKREGGK